MSVVSQPTTIFVGMLHCTLYLVFRMIQHFDGLTQFLFFWFHATPLNKIKQSLHTKSAKSKPSKQATIKMEAAPEAGCHTYEELAESKLGKANGNVFQLRPAEEMTHDGVIMVRLKKKRFIVIDYSLGQYDATPPPHTAAVDDNIDPLDPDHNHHKAPNSNPNTTTTTTINTNTTNTMMTPHRQAQHRSICINHDCPKVGIPNLVYDSEPTEPTSLYLRSGLCFVCQRNVNEKRRTQRKRKSAESNLAGNSKKAMFGNVVHHTSSSSSNPFVGTDVTSSSIMSTLMGSVGMGDVTSSPFTMGLSHLTHTPTTATTTTSAHGTLEQARTALDEARQHLTLLLTLNTNMNMNMNNPSSLHDDDVTAVPIILKPTHDTTNTTATAASKADAILLHEHTLASLRKSMTLLEQWKVEAKFATNTNMADAVATAAHAAANSTISNCNTSNTNSANSSSSMMLLLGAAKVGKEASAILAEDVPEECVVFHEHEGVVVDPRGESQSQQSSELYSV
mmetsp:Transcript_1047/g.1490  ORF Transcript_1047/g.1490 Transcript_1047/m.1490 type:complete len:507 (-) Transcript_1047:134-1654(-)